MRNEEYKLNGSDCSLSGFKIGKVINNRDSKAQERVLVRVIGVHDMLSIDPEYGVIAMHCAPSKSFSGEIPDIGDMLWVSFIDNDPSQLLWHGWVRHTG
jgi:hypothetical protein